MDCVDTKETLGEAEPMDMQGDCPGIYTQRSGSAREDRCTGGQNA